MAPFLPRSVSGGAARHTCTGFERRQALDEGVGVKVGLFTIEILLLKGDHFQVCFAAVSIAPAEVGLSLPVGSGKLVELSDSDSHMISQVHSSLLIEDSNASGQCSWCPK